MRPEKRTTEKEGRSQPKKKTVGKKWGKEVMRGKRSGQWKHLAGSKEKV